MSLENMGRSKLSNNKAPFKSTKILSKFGTLFRGANLMDNSGRASIVYDAGGPKKAKGTDLPVDQEQPAPVSEMPVEPAIEEVLVEKTALSGSIDVESNSSITVSSYTGSIKTTSRF